MREKIATASLNSYLHLLNLAVITIFLIHYINCTYPMVGHDFSYFLPRLLDTHLFYLINGIGIQWYTPSFGTGLPAYPNPQHIQFSLPQFLMFFIDPWQSTVISIIALAWIGYFGCYFLLSRTLGFSREASTVASFAFAVNGFYLNQMTAGHLGYLGYPLLPLLLVALIDVSVPTLIASIIGSLILALLIHGAGFYLLVVFVLSIMIALPMIYLIRPMILNINTISIRVITVILLALGLSGSKIYAVQAFMSFFPREIQDNYRVDGFSSLFGVMAQLSASTIINPIVLFIGKNTNHLGGYLAEVTGASYGIWELDTSISAVFLIACVGGMMFQAYWLLHHKQRPNLSQAAVLLLLLTGIWIAIQFATTQGPIYQFTRSLPFFRSLHVNVRFTAAFIVPIVILGVYFLDKLLRNRAWLFLGISATAILSVLPYYLLNPELYLRAYDVTAPITLYKLISGGERFPITRVADISDEIAIINRSSSLRPDEPIFGYRLEHFPYKTKEGPVTESDGEFLNMTNPTTLVFPDKDSKPFERIKVADISDLYLFTQRREPTWDIPVTAKALNWLSVITLLLEVVILSAFAWRLTAKQKHVPVKAENSVSQVTRG